MSQTIQIGDCLRFSVALLNNIYERPNHESERVQVVEIQEDEDGCKVLVLCQVDEKLVE